MFVYECRSAVTSLQNAGGSNGGMYRSNVGAYAGGMCRSNVPMRVVQSTTLTNNSIDRHTAEPMNFGIKQEVDSRKRKRQSVLPCLTMSYEVVVGAWEGKLRVTVCWRELLYDDDSDDRWVHDNLIY